MYSFDGRVKKTALRVISRKKYPLSNNLKDPISHGAKQKVKRLKLCFSLLRQGVKPRLRA